MNYKRYRERFYARKLSVTVFYLIIYEVLAFFAAKLINMQSGLSNSGYGWEMVGVAAIFLPVSIYISRLRYLRVLEILRLEEPDDQFWADCVFNSYISLFFWGIPLAVFAMSIFSGSQPQVGLIGCFVLIFAGILLVQVLYNAELKKLAQNGIPAKASKPSAIAWGREILITLIHAAIQIVWGLSLYLIFEADSSFVSDAEFTILAVLLTAALIGMIIRIVLIRKDSDDEVIGLWLKKQEEENDTHIHRLSVSKPNEMANTEENEKSDWNFQVNAPEPRYADCQSLDALCEMLVQYAGSNETVLSTESAREILAALSATRAVWLLSEDTAYASRIAEVIQGFFTDFSSATQVPDTVLSLTSLMQSNLSNGVGFGKKLAIVKARTNSVNVLAFTFQAVGRFNEIFNPFVQYFYAPEGENVLKIPTGTLSRDREFEMSLPANAWFVFTAKNRKELPVGASKYASVVDLPSVSKFGKKELICRQYVLPYARFNELMAEALQNNFLSLEIWKKFDAMEEYLNANVGFSIGNVMARQIEGYSSVLLACGEETMDVVDKVIAEKILPCISGRTKDEINQEGKTFPELLDGLFGLDNLPRSHRTITNYGWA